MIIKYYDFYILEYKLNKHKKALQNKIARRIKQLLKVIY